MDIYNKLWVVGINKYPRLKKGYIVTSLEEAKNKAKELSKCYPDQPIYVAETILRYFSRVETYEHDTR